MRPLITIGLLLLALAALCGCGKIIYGVDLHEDAIVYDTCYIPAQQGTASGIGLDGDGDVTVNQSDITIPATYSIVFKCKHGKFAIGGARAEELYKQLDKGDAVTVTYCEKYSVEACNCRTGLVTNFVSLHFIDAVKKAEPLVLEK